MQATRLLVRSPLRDAVIKPDAKLDTLLLPLRPSDASLSLLGSAGNRDMLPRGRAIYRLLLTYKFSLAEGERYSLSEQLYAHQSKCTSFMHAIHVLYVYALHPADRSSSGYYAHRRLLPPLPTDTHY